MRLASGAVNGEIGESAKSLGKFETWKESVVMMGAFMAVGKALEGAKGLAPVEKLGGTIQGVRGGKFLLS